MLRRFSLDFAIFSIAFDAFLIALALWTSTTLRPWLSRFPYIKFIPEPAYLPAVLYGVFPILWVAILFFSSVYDYRRNLRLWRETSSILIGSIFAISALAGVLYLTYRDVSRALFITFVCLALALLLGWRMLYRLLHRFGILKGAQPRNILIVGTGALANELHAQISAYHKLGLRVVGFLDDESAPGELPGERLGPIASARQIILEKKVDDVVIALSPQQYELVFRLVKEVTTLPVKVWVIPDYFNLALFKIDFEELAGIPMLDLRAPALTHFQRLVKRSFDLTVTLLSMPVALPLMGLIALILKFDRSGAVLFRQARVGENGRTFNIIKFRTMTANPDQLPIPDGAPETTQPYQIKSSADPRVTRIGRFLRRTSLDELPQLFNVLKGEMSLVGPRPELPELVKNYEPWQYKRFSVPPGMTGWWQVHGRSDRPLHLNTQDDLYYIENYSILLDILILIYTIGAVISGKGAY